MPYFRLPAAALAAFGLVLGAAGLAPATAGEPAGVQLAQAESYSDEKLQSFAMAALEVRDIRERYSPQMQSAESDEERQALAEQATAEMVSAVEASPGITVDEYNAIIQASNGNEQLTNRIREQLQSVQQ